MRLICLSFVVLWSLAVAGGPVSAQVRTLPGRRPSQAANPVHERLKKDAQAAYEKGDYPRTIELTSMVLRANPRDHVAYYFRANAKLEQGLASQKPALLREAIADARQAVGLAADQDVVYYLPYLYGMTNLSAMEGRKEHAEVTLKVATQVLASPRWKPGDRANLFYQRALAQLQLKSPDAAAKDFSEAVRLDKKHLASYFGLAGAYATAGKTDKATAAFGQAVAAFPNDPVVYNNRGQFMQEHGKYDEAVADFTRAVELQPKFTVAYINRGFALMESGDLESAETDFTAVLKVDANQPMVYGLRGSARLSQGKIKEAIADHEQVVRLDPRNSVAHGDLGFARYFNGEYADATRAFNQAVSLDEKLRYLDPWRFRALELQDKPDDAKALFDEVAKKDAKDRDWVDNLLAYLSGSQNAEGLLKAAESPDAAIKDARGCEAHFFIAERASQAGRVEEAKTHYEKSLASKSRHLSAYRGAQFAVKKLNK
jgi:tetratricopeptide (TPR) repeat protein